jgi:peptidoglycan/xylan/chitin deacetylase (PgdA/CDA1 family)
MKFRNLFLAFLIFSLPLVFQSINCGEQSKKQEQIEKEEKQQKQNTIPILMYHWIVPENHKMAKNRYAQTKEQFKDRIKNMKEKGYNFITVSELEKIISDSSTDTTKYALITIDDGLRCVYDHAYPILKKENTKATLFIVNVCIKNKENKIYLSWPQLEEMYNSGLIDVQSHTYNSHILLGKGKSTINSMVKNEDSSHYFLRLVDDFKKSKQEIESKIGNKVIALSWPFGFYNHEAKTLAESVGYKLFFGVECEQFEINKKYDALPRIEIFFVNKFKEIVK